MGRGNSSADQLALDSAVQLRVEPSGKRNNDLGEVNGYPVNARSQKAKKAWEENLCPFLGRTCPKSNAGSLPSCSILSDGQLRITCPHRLLDARGEIEDVLGGFFFAGKKKFHVVEEVAIPETFISEEGESEETSAGRADLVFIEDSKEDDREVHLCELQTEYVSGNIGEQVRQFLADPAKDNKNRPIKADGKEASARPDSLSSSFKRLFPQILRKGAVFSSEEWGGGKIGVVTPRSFFDSFSRQLPQVGKEEADIAWVVCDTKYDSKLGRNRVFVADTIYTTLSAVEEASRPSPGDKKKFIEGIDRKRA